MLNPFKPANLIEKVILDVKAGRLPMKVLAGTLLGSEVLLPSATEVTSDLSGFQPLLFKKDQEDLIAVFTSSPLILPYRKSAEFFVSMQGFEAFRRMPKEFGISLNANSPVALDITAEGLQKIIHDFS